MGHSTGSLNASGDCEPHAFEQLCTILSLMSILRVLLAAVALSAVTAAQQVTTFSTDDGGLISAQLYGKGARGVVLAHGGQFTKESWRDQARVLAAHGFHVLAFDFRGFGGSRGPGQADFDTAPFHKDVLGQFVILKRTAQQPCRWSEAALAAGLPVMRRLN